MNPQSPNNSRTPGEAKSEILLRYFLTNCRAYPGHAQRGKY